MGLGVLLAMVVLGSCTGNPPLSQSAPGAGDTDANTDSDADPGPPSDTDPAGDGEPAADADRVAQRSATPVSAAAVLSTAGHRLQLTAGTPVSVLELRSTDHVMALGVGLASAPR